MASSSSVTGVGQGSALKIGVKGAPHMTLGVENLIGSRIVLAGSITLSASTGTVTFPGTLPGVAADYIVITQANSTNSSWPSSFTTASFTMNGTSGNIVSYVVVKVNNATV